MAAGVVVALNLASLRAIADRARKIKTPINTTNIVVRTRTWTGEVGTPPFTDSDLVLDPAIDCQKPSVKEVMTSGGYYELDDVKVGPITPPYSVPGRSGGYTTAQIAPATAGPLPKNVEIKYILSGALAGEYRLQHLQEEQAFHYTLVLRRRSVTAGAQIR